MNHDEQMGPYRTIEIRLQMLIQLEQGTNFFPNYFNAILSKLRGSFFILYFRLQNFNYFLIQEAPLMFFLREFLKGPD